LPPAKDGAVRLEGGIGVLDTRRNLVRSMFLDAVADDSDEATITNSVNKMPKSAQGDWHAEHKLYARGMGWPGRTLPGDDVLAAQRLQR
jgi:hypothetical protein